MTLRMKQPFKLIINGFAPLRENSIFGSLIIKKL
jgi:hypothetical protein